MPGLEGCLHCMGLGVRKAPKPCQCAEVPTLCWTFLNNQSGMQLLLSVPSASIVSDDLTVKHICTKHHESLMCMMYDGSK